MAEQHSNVKPPLASLSPAFLCEMASVAEFGDQKYGRGDWLLRASSVEGLLSAMLRHALAIVRGEDADAESGLSHAAHVAFRAMMVYETLRRSGEDDRRWKK